MTLLKVQEYLRSGKTLDQLYEEHGIFSRLYNEKISLLYDQLAAKESDELANQCRGLVLDAHTYERIAVPFFRFFNYGQGCAAPIDWDSAAIESKEDGSLAIVYHHNNQWHMATRSMPEASGKAHDVDMTFSQLFDYTIEHMFGNTGGKNWLMRNQDPSLTFCFELTTPYNRVVVKYNEPSLTLLAVRSRESLQELDPRLFVSDLSIPTPKLYNFNNLEHLLQVVREWNPLENEGVVVKDDNFNRIKIKNPSYIAYNKLNDSLSTSARGCLEVVLLGKDDDVVPMMPPLIANRIIQIKDATHKLINIVEKEYEEIRNIKDQKEFALIAQKSLWPAALFSLRRKKVESVREYMCSFSDNGHIKTPMLDTILELCKKLNPDINI